MINEELKNKLIEERNLLNEELSSLGHKVASGDFEAQMEETHEADNSDRADRLEDFEERNSMIKTLEKRLEEVTNALSLMDEGKYGICEVCGSQIEEDRLDANPAAATCKAHMNQ